VLIIAQIVGWTRRVADAASARLAVPCAGLPMTAFSVTHAAERGRAEQFTTKKATGDNR
jgi:hypothetical protein